MYIYICMYKQDSMITTTQIQICFYVIATKKQNSMFRIIHIYQYFKKVKPMLIKMSKYSKPHTKSIKI